ncbi:DUF4760 domain-containing protein [bacterium]|nr:DUF4760 domain-containing protein [bacterium]MBU1957489.1 DUF4760 domain-containing protein [bacterium]
MNLDTLGNLADIIALPIAILGVVLIVHQLKLVRLESEIEHQRRQNEMTLNAYNTIKGDLSETIWRVREKLNLEDMFDEFTEEHLEQIMNDKLLRDDVARMLDFLNKFAVGIKYDVFNILLVNDLAGKLFIRTHKQFEPYIERVRKNSNTFYLDYENLVAELKVMRNYKE